MLTTEQRNEMRRCIVGPCSERELNFFRDWFIETGETVEDVDDWYAIQGGDIFIAYDENGWFTTRVKPITAADFIKTYLKP